MILFLRTKNNETIVDLEYYIDGDHLEVSSFINIKNYSKFLLKQEGNKIEELIETISQLSEEREWLWEVWFSGRKNTKDDYDEVLKVLRDKLKFIAKFFDLIYVED